MKIEAKRGKRGNARSYLCQTLKIAATRRYSHMQSQLLNVDSYVMQDVNMMDLVGMAVTLGGRQSVLIADGSARNVEVLKDLLLSTTII